MPSFTNRRYTPDRLSSLPQDDLMDDITHHSTSPNRHHRPKHTNPSSLSSSSLGLVPSNGSLLDHFDLPSPPSTPHRSTHSLSYSSLSSAAATGSPSLAARSFASSTPTSSPPSSSTTPRWPTASQRIARLPMRSRSHSSSSSASSSSSSSSYSSSSASSPRLDLDADVEMGGMPATTPISGSGTPPPLIRSARRTPYYPPNASRNSDRTRVYMNRGPHYIANWTPLSSLPRHVQLRIEERMVRFTA
ncbi:hypothetical protein NEMBOFW57_004270 [Staphylotrichum longicolle]|uniref:Uncharacterized protein n=1 Tax=Staphylotrichum longicolle TaxID=669026 RepID=A0AAD4F7R6_9PEZI|nr:hypothetical protein NEMBOFW57_004270 [Staphylotrichum longicolle]